MITPNLKKEQEYWSQEMLVCGVDEVGRGCLAGPVVAAALVMPQDHVAIINVRDSKKLTPKMRREVCEAVLAECNDFGIGLVPAIEIDKIGIEQATKQAMFDAISQIKVKNKIVLIDGNKPLEMDIRQKNIIRGDATVYSISAASIIAKVFRDQVLIGMDNAYPEYGFAGHKGYHSINHVEALKKHGLTPEHRRYFLRSILNES